MDPSDVPCTCTPHEALITMHKAENRVKMLGTLVVQMCLSLEYREFRCVKTDLWQ